MILYEERVPLSAKHRFTQICCLHLSILASECGPVGVYEHMCTQEYRDKLLNSIQKTCRPTLYHQLEPTSHDLLLFYCLHLLIVLSFPFFFLFFAEILVIYTLFYIPFTLKIFLHPEK